MPVKALKIVLLLITSVTFTLFILEFLPTNNIFRQVDYKKENSTLDEEYNPALARLNSLHRFEHYCDSIYNSRNIHLDKSESKDIYPGIVVEAIKQKFYHGYSYYGITDNYLARALEPLFINLPVSAIVDPSDIVKYPMAACSQQSIVFNKILTNKGYNVRKVGFYHPEGGGHFAQEVFYDGSWHFYDPNKELDFKYLQSLNRPSVEFLAQNPDVLVKAYQYKDTEGTLKRFPTYFYGKPNKIEGLNALIYQKTTKVLSYSIWIFFFALYIMVRRKEKQALQTGSADKAGNTKFNSPLKVIYKRKSA